MLVDSATAGRVEPGKEVQRVSSPLGASEFKDLFQQLGVSDTPFELLRGPILNETGVGDGRRAANRPRKKK